MSRPLRWLLVRDGRCSNAPTPACLEQRELGRARRDAEAVAQYPPSGTGDIETTAPGAASRPPSFEEDPCELRSHGPSQVGSLLAPVHTRPKERSSLRAGPLEVDADVCKPDLAPT